MKQLLPKTGILLVQLLAAALSESPCNAHNENVHRFITDGAFYSSSGINSFLSVNLDPGTYVLRAKPHGYSMSYNQQPILWLEWGAYYEDMEDPIFLGNSDSPRAQDHFYTVTFQPPRIPGQVIGLTDRSESPLFLLDFPAANSFAWAAIKGVKPPVKVLPNDQTWQNARDYEFAAFTNAIASAREENLALMLDSLGHVLHLNQDLSSPDHVRNDNHYNEKHRFIENYGAIHYHPEWFNQQPRGWAYWQGKGFAKLLDFWDTGKYAGGSSSALTAEAADTTKLGLAEFSNGNFLGEDALYNEAVGSDAVHSFPFPSINSSTTFPSVRSHLAGGVATSYLKDGTPIQRIYLNKTGDGIPVTHHSVLNYLGAVYPRKSGAIAKVAVTVNDPNVLEDYHSILIPKAVEYSAGLLDYFFRGQIDLSIQGSRDTGTFVFTITNTSSQDLQGGSFTLLKQDASGNRTIVGQYAVSGTLATNNSMDVHYADTSITTGTQFFLVYKGTIGLTSGSASDPVDDGIAMAVKKFGVFGNDQFDLWKCWNWEWSYFGTVPANYAFSPASVADANSIAAVNWQVDNGLPPGSNCL